MGNTPQWGVAHPPGGQRPISLEYQIYLPAIDTIVTGMGRPGEGVARNTLFEMWTEANEGVESVLRAEGKRLKRCSQAVATRSRIRSVSFHCAKFLSGEKVPQRRTIRSSKFMALREVSPAFLP